MKHYLIAALVLTGFTLHAFDSTIEFRHRESEGVGYNQGYSTIEFIGNQNWEKCELLLDVRGHIFNNGRLAANGGIGLRKPFKNERYLFGLNAFYDVRETSELIAEQAGVGLEFLTKRADLRANGYLPFSKRSDFEQKTFATFSGNGVYVKQRAEATLPCVDLELGVPVKSIVYLAAGTYYLFENNVHGMHTGNAWGGKFRVAVDVTDFLSLSAIVTHDSIFNTRVQGYISFNIALEKFRPKKANRASKKAPKKPYRNLRNVPITRNEIIPIQKKHRTAPLSKTTSDGDLTSIIFVNNIFKGLGKGTFEEPYTSLKEAEASSKPGDIIYVLPGDGTSHNMEEGIVLKENQTLTSSGVPLAVSDIVIPPQTPDQKPVITNIHSGKPVITHAKDSHAEDAFVIIDPYDYIFSDWDSSSYDDITPPDLLGGDASGAVAHDLDIHEGVEPPDFDFEVINPSGGDSDRSESPIYVTGSDAESEPANVGDDSDDSQDSFTIVDGTGTTSVPPPADSGGSSWSWPWH
jgi:hypothetical protein